jgi:dipeptidyl aminopeptidase/acylaminoacyl peptidase
MGLDRPSDPLPIESFFSAPSRSHEILSPSGLWISYLGPDDKGVTHLWVVKVDSPHMPMCLSTPESGGVTACFWISGDRLIWQSQSGDKSPTFYQGLPQTGITRQIPMSHREPFVTLAGVVETTNTATILFGISDEPTTYPDIFKLPLTGDGKTSHVFTNSHRVVMWSLDKNARPVVGLRWTMNGEKELVDIRSAEGRVVYRVASDDDLRIVSSSADGRYTWMITNKDADLTRLERLELESGKTETIASDPFGQMDVESIVLDPHSLEPLAVSYSDESIRWQGLDSSFDELLKLIKETKPDYDLISVEASRDRKKWLLSLRRGGNPSALWLYDSVTQNMRHLWDEHPDLNEALLAEVRPFRYKSRDGTEIPAFLSLPRIGKAPWPLVVFPHGGPNMRTTTGFDGRVQFLASRGYAVLQPNFRGSRGYGKTFMNAGDRQWGKGCMQTDVTDGLDYLIREGIADPLRVAILGGSYGGYSALAGLAFTPDRYAAGICLFGISDLIDYATNTPIEWQAYAGDSLNRLGDPSTPTGRSLLHDRSPINYAKSFHAPLLIYHGAVDNLIPASQSRQMVAALQRNNKVVEFLVAPEEAHGFSIPESEMAVYRAIELFLHKHLGGGVGPKPSEAVVRRLNMFRASARSDFNQD